MRLSPGQRTAAAIAAATILNLPFGTLYAFSVFLRQLEAQLGVGRTETSFVFALATIVLTVGMNLAPRLYRALPPAALALGCGACSVAGLLLAANARGLAQFALGYGVLYALGAGVAFTLCQQGVNQTVKDKSGLANGFIVSLYPLGAMIGAPLFGWTVEAHGLTTLLLALGTTVACASALSAALLRIAGIRMHDALAPAPKPEDAQWPLFLRLATVFFLAASAGLMVMSQAAGIVKAYGGASALALGATTFIAGAVAAARIGGGWLVDHFSVPRVALGAHLWSLAGAIALTFWPAPLVTLPALAMIGMGYGLVSGLTAAAIARYWPKNAYGRVASLLYVAWCAAALSLPVLAGWLFDRTGGYGSAVLIAAGINLLGAFVASGLPARASSA
ncbi:MAG TPA: MFS transporter [Burkholderiales bacterium]|jgi:MFS family permease|nr:MFS transporter [Burkholderiales bacterium]